jgi:hypothetical protein
MVRTLAACLALFHGAFADETADVIICAAQCQSEPLGHLGHDLALVGTIYYAPYSAEKSASRLVCMSEAVEMQVYSDRKTDDALNLCAAAMMGRYEHKRVRIQYAKVRLEDDRVANNAVKIVRK